MRTIYEIVYIPWENNTEGRPWLYSGSDYYSNTEYLGSASSSKVHEWSNGLSVREWWAQETKKHPENFHKNILVSLSEDVTRVELQSLEAPIQKSEDHRNDSKYFNRTNKHFNTHHTSNKLKGMSYEEIYGKEKALELKNSKSIHFKRLRDKLDQSGSKNPMAGRSAAKEQNLKWYTNGVEVIFVSEGTAPAGFVRGRKLNVRF